jgi:hypothetical protein
MKHVSNNLYFVFVSILQIIDLLQNRHHIQIYDFKLIAYKASV